VQPEQPPVRPAPAPDAGQTAPVAVPIPRESSGAQELNRSDVKTVLVNAYDGPAEVTNKDGQVLGSTPYALKGPFGTSNELWLRREGFQPHHATQSQSTVPREARRSAGARRRRKE